MKLICNMNEHYTKTIPNMTAPIINNKKPKRLENSQLLRKT